MRCYFTFLIALAGLQLVYLEPDCNSDSCSCQGQTLAGKFSYPVKITATDPSNGQQYDYTFSPCPGNVDCANSSEPVVICQHDRSMNTDIIIGVAHQVKWSFNDSDPTQFTVEYPGGDKTYDNKTRKAILSVTVISQGGAEFKSTGENSKDKEIDYLFSAIVSSSQQQPEPPIGYAGLVIIILLIMALIAYFIIGGIVMYKVKGARGKEVIPNVTFWTSLPLLIKDGVLFTLSPCLKKCGKKSSYSPL